MKFWRLNFKKDGAGEEQSDKDDQEPRDKPYDNMLRDLEGYFSSINVFERLSHLKNNRKLPVGSRG